MPRGNRKRINDNRTRKGALNLARRRLERAYGMKGECNFSAEELDELRQIFEFYDIDSSKTMDLSELNMALRALGYNASENEVQDLASLMDVDGDMTMDFSEFCMIVEFMKEDKGFEEELRDAFRCIDTNGDGYVTAEELLDLLMTQGNTMSLKEASELIRFVDKNGDGRLDYEEFMRVILESRNVSRSSTFYSVASLSAQSLLPKQAKESGLKRLQKQLSMDEIAREHTNKITAETNAAPALVTDTDVAVATTSLSNVKIDTARAQIQESEDMKLQDIAASQDNQKNNEDYSLLTGSSPANMTFDKTNTISLNVVGPSNGEVLGSVLLEKRS